MHRQMIVRVVIGVVVVAGALGLVVSGGGQQRTFAQENMAEPFQGTKGKVVGLVTDRKEKGWLEVKADGEEKARRYWRFGNRAAINKKIDLVKIGDRVQLSWESEREGPHIADVEILKKAPAKQ